MKLYISAFPIIILLIISGCLANHKLSQAEIAGTKLEYQQVAQKKFGDKVKYLFSQNKNYVLCQKISPYDQSIPNKFIEFFVFDMQHKGIIHEDKIANSEISWHSNTRLLITNQRGYITSPTDTGKWIYIYDLLTKKKITQEK